MKAITNDQLWDEIHKLQGQIVCTPQQQKRNLVKSVSSSLVTFRLLDENRDRKANLSRNDIWRCYRLAMQYGVLTGKDLPAEFFNHRISRICMGLLAKALPKQIRAFRIGEGPIPNLSGIEVYNKDC